MDISPSSSDDKYDYQSLLDGTVNDSPNFRDITQETNISKYSKFNDKTKFPCNCKNSQCLKLYCECFAGMLYCDPKLCGCKNCMNNIANNDIRIEVIKGYLIKSPNSFKKFINYNTVTKVVNTIKGCSCKKSFCLKRYCECYQEGRKCGRDCKCSDCKNTNQDEKNSTLIKKGVSSMSFTLDSNHPVKRLEAKKIVIVPYKIIIDNYEIYNEEIKY